MSEHQNISGNLEYDDSLAVQKVVALASRQTNQKQIYHFLYSARHFLGCAGVHFSRSQDPDAYSSSAKRTFASEVRLSLSSQRLCVCTGFLQAKHWIFVDANLGSATAGWVRAP